MREAQCPCGHRKPYHQCCEPLHLGVQPAKTAQQLMRSRYSAFYYGGQNRSIMVNYLLNTHHPSQHHPDEREGLTETMRHKRWTGLQILNTEAGQAGDQQGVVEFVAYLQDEEGQRDQHHERSRFCQEQGQWFYVDGDILPPIEGHL